MGQSPARVFAACAASVAAEAIRSRISVRQNRMSTLRQRPASGLRLGSISGPYFIGGIEADYSGKAASMAYQTQPPAVIERGGRCYRALPAVALSPTISVIIAPMVNLLSCALQ